MAQLPTDRSIGNTRAEHISDHNELHRLHDVIDALGPLATDAEVAAAVAVETARALAVEAAKADLVGGVVPDAQIPGGVTRDSELTAAFAAFVAGAPGALDQWLELVAAIQADQTGLAALTTTVAGKETPAGAQAKVDTHATTEAAARSAAIAALSSTYVPLTALPVTPEQYGAVGDGVTDDSTAMQAFINAIAATRGAGKLGPNKTYYCATTLAIPATFIGCILSGYGRLDQQGAGRGSAIKMASNVPAFQFAAGTDNVGAHLSLFSDFAVTWAAASGTGNTNQIAFLFKDTARAAPSWFHNTFSRLSVNNAYDAWKVDGNGGQSPNVWDTHWNDIQIEHLQHDGWNLSGPTAIGQPISTFRDIYVANTATPVVTSTGLVFRFTAVEAAMSGLDIEGWANRIMVATGGFNVSIDGIHIEHHVFDGATTDYTLFFMANGKLTINNISTSGTSLGGAYAITAIAQTDTGGIVKIDALSTAWSSVVGELDVFYGAGGSYELGSVAVISGVTPNVPSAHAATAAKTIGVDAAVSAFRLGANHFYFTTGVPTGGANGDYALRLDGTVAGKTCLYHREAGAWTPVVP